GLAEDQPEPAAAGPAARSEAVGTELPRRAAGRRRGPAASAALLRSLQQTDRAADLGHRRLQAAGHPADLRPPAGRQHALLAAPGPRLRARRPDRHRLSLGHRQRRRLAARRDLIAGNAGAAHPPSPAIVRTPSAVNTSAATMRIALTGSRPAIRSPITTTGILASIMPSVVPSTTG